MSKRMTKSRNKKIKITEVSIWTYCEIPKPAKEKRAILGKQTKRKNKARRKSQNTPPPKLLSKG